MSKQAPKNKEEAITYEWEDWVKTLRAHAMVNDIEGFYKHLKVLQQSIENAQRDTTQPPINND